MKKFISVAMSLVIFSTMLLGFGVSANAAAYCHLSKYKNVFKKVYNQSLKDKKYVDKSHFFYFNFEKKVKLQGKGQKELVMLATKKKSKKIGAYLYVYTIKNGKVKSVIKNKHISDYSGEDDSVQVGVATSKGKNYLFVKKDSFDSNTSNSTTIKLYSIKGTKAKCKYTAVSNAKYNEKKSKWNVTVKINNKKKSNSYFMKWQKKYKLFFTDTTLTLKDGVKYFNSKATNKSFNPDKFKGDYSWYTSWDDGATSYATKYPVNNKDGRYHWDEFGNIWTDKDIGEFLGY